MLQKVSYDRNIVQYYGACLTAEQPMLIMEFCAVRQCRSTVLGHEHMACRSSDNPGNLASDSAYSPVLLRVRCSRIFPINCLHCREAI